MRMAFFRWSGEGGKTRGRDPCKTFQSNVECRVVSTVPRRYAFGIDVAAECRSKNFVRGGAMAVFGTEFCDTFAVMEYANGEWSAPEMRPLAPLPIHPAAHVLHYASTCFEGFKAYRWQDGSARVFRIDDHVQRMRRSAESLHLPVPSAEFLKDVVMELVRKCLAAIPEPPGALYLRPTLVGTTPNIGAAASPPDEALLYVLASPVGDYFAGGLRPLRLLALDQLRTVSHLGSTKTGGNYAAALGPTLAAKAASGVDQVLFCPDGDVQETGAANFLVLSRDRVLTKPLSTEFLHGVTRSSILTLAAARGMAVEERGFTLQELLGLIESDEAALSGTAACLTPVGEILVGNAEYKVSNGSDFPIIQGLREHLCQIHSGEAEDQFGWLTKV